jgi:hypothetical protein
LGSCKIEDAQAIREGKNQQICLKKKDLLFRKNTLRLETWFLEMLLVLPKKDVMLDLELTKQAKRFI